MHHYDAETENELRYCEESPTTMLVDDQVEKISDYSKHTRKARARPPQALLVYKKYSLSR